MNYIKTSIYNEISHTLFAGTIDYAYFKSLILETPDTEEVCNRILFLADDGNLSLVIENNQTEAGYENDFTLAVLSIPAGSFTDSDVIVFENYPTYREALEALIEISITDYEC